MGDANVKACVFGVGDAVEQAPLFWSTCVGDAVEGHVTDHHALPLSAAKDVDVGRPALVPDATRAPGIVCSWRHQDHDAGFFQVLEGSVKSAHFRHSRKVTIEYVAGEDDGLDGVLPRQHG